MNIRKQKKRKQISKDIVVHLPKHISAAITVELSEKDFKKRLPTPIVQSLSNV